METWNVTIQVSLRAYVESCANTRGDVPLPGLISIGNTHIYIYIYIYIIYIYVHADIPQIRPHISQSCQKMLQTYQVVASYLNYNYLKLTISIRSRYITLTRVSYFNPWISQVY